MRSTRSVRYVQPRLGSSLDRRSFTPLGQSLGHPFHPELEGSSPPEPKCRRNGIHTRLFRPDNTFAFVRWLGWTDGANYSVGLAIITADSATCVIITWEPTPSPSCARRARFVISCLLLGQCECHRLLKLHGPSLRSVDSAKVSPALGLVSLLNN